MAESAVRLEAVEEPLVTTAYISRWLGIPPRTLFLWAECGEIPAIKIRRQWRFRRSEVKQWYQGRARTSSC